MAVFTEAINENTLKACKYFRGSDLMNLLKYVLGSHCTRGYSLILGIPAYEITMEMIAKQFLAVRERFGRENKGSLVHHFILSFSVQEANLLSVPEMFIIGKMICDKYFEGKYAVIALHENTDNMHLHFVINTASHINGNVLSKHPYMERTIGVEVDDEIKRKTETIAETLDRM